MSRNEKPSWETINEKFTQFSFREDTIALQEGTGDYLVGKKTHYIDTSQKLHPITYLELLQAAGTLTSQSFATEYHEEYSRGIVEVMHGRPPRIDVVHGGDTIIIYEMPQDRLPHETRDDTAAMLKIAKYDRSDLGLPWHDTEMVMLDSVLEGKRIRTRRIVGNISIPVRTKRKWWD